MAQLSMLMARAASATPQHSFYISQPSPAPGTNSGGSGDRTSGVTSASSASYLGADLVYGHQGHSGGGSRPNRLKRLLHVRHAAVAPTTAGVHRQSRASENTFGGQHMPGRLHRAELGLGTDITRKLAFGPYDEVSRARHLCEPVARLAAVLCALLLALFIWQFWQWEAQLDRKLLKKYGWSNNPWLHVKTRARGAYGTVDDNRTGLDLR